ncbi:M15 family metallopeptidase [Microbacterium sp. RD1]|uniref:M15 family metallopeptidase n=1 Tax=Microbacterium sp. RD1 TaxID=3457313 RepID=UPI003FA5C59F
MTAPDPHAPTRRALREAARSPETRAGEARARHARRREAGIRRLIALAGAVVLFAGGVTAVTAALAAPALTEPTVLGSPEPRESIQAEVRAVPEEGLPSPVMSAEAGAAGAGTLCEGAPLQQALAAGDDAATIAATGGPEAFRAAVAAGAAPCVRLDDPARVWMIVNKTHPYNPIDAAPAELVAPPGVRSLEESRLRPDAAAALSAMVTGAADAGAGEVGLASAYRSYATQQQTYSGHVADRGVAGADLVSARPGYSEHQSGLTVDVVPCTASCASIDDLAASPQGAWIAEHAWEYGWIVRYAEGRTDVTGYAPEPWHLRYIGTELARAYHEGGWTTLEEFFALPPAPSYAE